MSNMTFAKMILAFHAVKMYLTVEIRPSRGDLDFGIPFGDK